MISGHPATAKELNKSELCAGNPVSSIVCFHLFVRSALRQLAGHPSALCRVDAKCANDFKLDPERPEYHRVKLTWQPGAGGVEGGGCFVAESTGGQRSSRLLSVRSTLGLLEVPQGTEGQSVVTKGCFVPCILVDDLRGMRIV
jgi:gephyrin